MRGKRRGREDRDIRERREDRDIRERREERESLSHKTSLSSLTVLMPCRNIQQQSLHYRTNSIDIDISNINTYYVATSSLNAPFLS